MSLCRNRVARHLFRLVTVPEIRHDFYHDHVVHNHVSGARAIIVANKIQQVMTGIFKYIKINWATATSRFPWLADYFVLTETAFYEVTGKGVWTVVPKGFRLGSEEALAGEHADHLLYIIDEASGVSDRSFRYHHRCSYRTG